MIDQGRRSNDHGPQAADQRAAAETRDNTWMQEAPGAFAAPAEPAPGRAATLVSSFRFAFRGLGYLLATQRNAKIHAALGAAATALGLGLGIERVEWLALIVIIALVLAAEGVNTAVEATVDLASPGFHPLAAVAKDVAAGTVLLTAFAALAVGAVIFLPRLWSIVAPLL